MNAAETRLSAHGRGIAGRDARCGAENTEAIGLGVPGIDRWLGGGLARSALHEVIALQAGDAAAAAGFVLALALRGRRSGGRIAWIRHRAAEIETGVLHAPGLIAFGLDPRDLLLVRVRDGMSVLRAGHEAARCAALSAVVIEVFGERAAPDLTASRRLALAAGRSGLPCLMLRIGAAERPSAAVSRWAIKAAPSTPLPAGAPGHPAFDVTLLRHRHGLPSRSWRLEWIRDAYRFRECAPLSRAVVPLPADRPAAGGAIAPFRRTG